MKSGKTMKVKPKSKSISKSVAPKSKKPASAKCQVCYKSSDFCQCTVEERAINVFTQQAKTLRAGILAEVAEWIAAQSRKQRKPKAAERLAVMAEAVAQDRMV